MKKIILTVFFFTSVGLIYADDELKENTTQPSNYTQNDEKKETDTDQKGDKKRDEQEINRDLNDINNKLNENKDAKWEAGKNEIVEMDKKEREKLFSYKFKPLNAPYITDLDDKDIPPSFDLRNVEGMSFVTEARHQGKCGSCWAFAVTAALETYTLIYRGDYKPEPKKTSNPKKPELDLSEQVFLSCSGAGSCGGGDINPEYLQTMGLPEEYHEPYKGVDAPCKMHGGPYRIHSYGVVKQNLKDLRAAVYKYGALPTVMNIYEDFLYYKSGVYTHVWGEMVGMHAVTIVGYDDKGGYFIVKNSWGKNWGEEGFFRIAYSEINSAVNFASSTVAYKPPTRKVEQPRVNVNIDLINSLRDWKF